VTKAERAIEGIVFLILAPQQFRAVSSEQIEEEMERLLLDVDDPVLADSLIRQFYLGLQGRLSFYHPVSNRIVLVSDLLALCGPGSQVRCIYRGGREVCQN